MAVVQISCTPLGEGSGGLSKFVAGCLQLVKESGLNYQLTPMGTILEGELDEIFSLVRKMHESPFNAGAHRVSTLIKIDDRRDREHTMERKMRSVEEQLAE
ncbi:MTH1187 family thiamine-binding protein [uncultured Desulfuromonas sp.]|uniref:MTH1187 family thiamine-binding protein n=1 Tax=uncultured Desulfuromonas sp. TaxID=181013 RepID=UPI002AAA7DA8|nr:MTH1187 family thiamine-binding protein [uncultured Desulfuromonas sp.]